MIGDQGVLLTPDDDDFHQPATDEPMWQESTWFSFIVPERAIEGYVYPWARINQDLHGGGVMIWDDQGTAPQEALVWDYAWNLPLGKVGDLRDFTFPTGIGVRCLEPGTTFRLTYDQPHCGLDLTYTAIMEPHVVGKGDPPGLFSAHVDQPGHVVGTLRLGDETIPVDCYAMRDRSWGPRIEDRNLRMGYTHAQRADSAWLAFAQPDQGGMLTPGLGYLWRDGEAAVLRSGTREIERDGLWPKRVVIRAEDALGRTLEAVGETINRVSFCNIPWMFNWCSLTRFDWDGATAWGEDQDVWHTDRYRAFYREQRAGGR